MKCVVKYLWNTISNSFEIKHDNYRVALIYQALKKEEEMERGVGLH